MISAATPSGCRTVSTVRFAMLAVVVRPYERRPSPATNSPISTAASVSPSASCHGLAGLLRDDRGRLLSPLAKEERELADDVTARDGSALGPRGLRRARGSDRVVDVVRARSSDPAEQRLVGRSELVEPARRTRAGTRTPVDEVRDVRERYQADQPPSTTTFEPVTYDDASEARKTTAPSASRASSMRPIGDRAA